MLESKEQLQKTAEDKSQNGQTSDYFANGLRGATVLVDRFNNAISCLYIGPVLDVHSKNFCQGLHTDRQHLVDENFGRIINHQRNLFPFVDICMAKYHKILY